MSTTDQEYHEIFPTSLFVGSVTNKKMHFVFSLQNFSDVTKAKINDLMLVSCYKISHNVFKLIKQFKKEIREIEFYSDVFA